MGKTDVCKQWGMKPQAFDFLHIISGADETGIEEWFEERWSFSQTFKPFKKGNTQYNALHYVESAAGKLDKQKLAKYMLFEKQDYGVFMNHYLEYGRTNKICIQEVQFDNIKQACQAYKVQYEKVKAYADWTGLPERELVVAFSIWGAKVEAFEKAQKRAVARAEERQSTVIDVTPVQQSNEQPRRGTVPVTPSRQKPTQKQERHQNRNGGQTRTNNTQNKSNSSIQYKGKTYKDLFELVAHLQINATVLQQDMSANMTLEQAVEKQLNAKKSTRVTHNSMTINGVSYPNLKAVCLAYELNSQEVSYYKSKTKCTSYEAVMYFIEKKYG